MKDHIEILSHNTSDTDSLPSHHFYPFTPPWPQRTLRLCGANSGLAALPPLYFQLSTLFRRRISNPSPPRASSASVAGSGAVVV